MEQNTFKTKSGYCHVLPQKIVLTREGVIGNLSEVVAGRSVTRLLMIYGTLSSYLFYKAYKNFIHDDIVIGIIHLLIGTLLILGIIKSTNNSVTPIIERSSIKKVTFKKAISFMTRAYFIVIFEDTRGKLKKRLIILPGSLTNGEEATTIALTIMRREGLYT